jgi:aldehyde:ferredoxin oxidoreductase
MAKVGGYVGRFLHVDLSSGDVEDERPPESMLRSYLGGYGVGARVLFDCSPAGADPLGPDNVLGLVTGPLTGTPTLMGGRFCVVGKSPLTGGWGDANCGGRFGPGLKFAGYDAVFATGVSDDPVYLLIEDGHAVLCSADDLWGLDTVETQQALQERHGKDTQVACIGPAAERLSLFSCVITDGGRAAGRSGLGAVMGAKRLKGVAVRGRVRPPVARPEQVKELRGRYLPAAKVGLGGLLSQMGTAAITADLISIGRTPIRNWAGNYPDHYPDAESVSGPKLTPYEVRNYGCWGCPVACGSIVQWQSGGEQHEGHKPEYETLAACGTYCGIADVASIMSLNELCNRAGMDTISAGATIAFAMECYENGILTKGDLEGLELEWGDGDAAVALLNMIVDRRGVGDVLADGVRRASQRLGKDSEQFAIHAGGQELPAHDPRQVKELALQYQTSPTPGRHTQGGGWVGLMPPEVLQVFGLDLAMHSEDPLLFRTLGYRALMAWRNVVQASGVCFMGNDVFGPQYLRDFIAAVVGWDLDMAECLEIGERIEVVRHLFGLREGVNPLRIEVAPRATGHPPLNSGPVAGVTVDVENLRSAYLRVMDWDPETALPSRDRLRALGLEELAASMLGT